MSCRNATKEKYEKAVREYVEDPNCTLVYIAKKYHLHRGKFSILLKEKGIAIKSRGGRSKELADELNAAVQHYVTTGEGIEKTASQYNVDKRTLQVRLKRLGLTRNGFSAKNYSVNDDYFEHIDTEEQAYWFGFLLADGCIRYANRSAQITLELADQDYLHLQKFKECLRFSGPIVSRSNRNMSSVRISRLKMANDLSEKGCVPDKTHRGWVDCGAVTGFENAFIRGYCDGNGFIDKRRNRIIFVMGSNAICDGLTEMLEQYGARKSKDKKLSGAGNPTYRVSIENKTGFFKFLTDIYLNATIFLNRKMLTALGRLEAHYGQVLSEDHRKTMRNLAETTLVGESETEGSISK